MTIDVQMTGQSRSTRPLALALSVSLHAALGLALFMMARGVPHPDARMTGHRDMGISVTLIPLSAETTVDLAPLGPVAPEPLLPGTAPVPAAPEHGKPPIAPAIAKSGGEPTDRPVSNAAAGAPRTLDSLPDAEVSAYRAALREHLRRFRFYPPSAKSAGDEGRVTMHFVMSREGTVLDAWIEASSGTAEIDREALEAVRRAQPLPPLPAGWPAQLDISMALSFRLR